MIDLGWRDQWAEQRGDRDAVRIVAEHRGAYQAIDAMGKLAWSELTGRTFHRAADKRALPTVGDWVVVDRWAQAVAGNGAAVIREILPRTSLLVRKAAGEATTPQPLAANVDVGIVMTSANADISVARIDRYLALLRDAGIAPALVLSKVDLVDDPAPLVARLAAIAEPVIAVSMVTGAGVEAVRALGGPGRTAMLLGSSGVGKSSLLNALVASAVDATTSPADAPASPDDAPASPDDAPASPDDAPASRGDAPASSDDAPASRGDAPAIRPGPQATRPIRDDDRGRHTTTRRELFITPHGLWIDTPGLRELAHFVDNDDRADDDAAFDDIAELAAGCRFRDCRHKDEPGCAVRGAVEAARLASYHKLVSERASAKTRGAAAQRLAETRKVKVKKAPPEGEP